jgi:hypothetical protein
MRKSIVSLDRVFGLCLALALACPAAAQTGLGVVKGSVSDAAAASVPGAQVTLTNTETGVVREAQTNEAGIFEFPGVQIGNYQLVVSMDGFKKWETAFNLQAGQTAAIDPRLEVGSIETIVQVTDAAPVITTEGMAISDVKDALRIRQLPLNGRQITNLFDLTPGVEGGANARINGMKVGSAEISLDGVSLVDRFGGGISRVQPGLDTVAEFRVETVGSDARSSRPATVTLVTKSGTNEYHGSAFATHRNNAAGLRARQRQDTGDAAKLIRNEFGISGGGPVIKNKTFWFAAYEGSRARSNRFHETIVPYDSMWAGDESQHFDGEGNQYLTYDPLTTGADGRRTLFPNLMIPQTRISAFGKAMDELTPSPTSSANPYIAPNFRHFYPEINDLNHLSFKGDHNFSTGDVLTARFTRAVRLSELQGGRFGAPPPGCTNCGGSGLQDSKVYSTMLRWTHTFTPSFINELQLSNHRSTQNQGTLANDVPWAADLGLPDPFSVTGWPTLCPGGIWDCWDGDNRNDQNLTNYTIDNNVTWVRGRHSVKLGGKFRQEYNNIRELQQAQGSHDFGGEWTSQWDPVNQIAEPFGGEGLSSVILGLPTALRNQANRGYFYFEQFEMGLYVTDSWKVTPKTTLDIGVHYDRWAPYGEKRDRLVNLDMDMVANTFQVITPGSVPAEQITGILPSMLQSYADRGLSWVTADSVGFPSKLVPADNNNFGPRIGVAHRFTDKLVLRGGYGEYFWTMPLGQILASARTNPPFNLRYLNLIRDRNGLEPFYALTNAPAPGDMLPNAQVDVNSAAGLGINSLLTDVWDVRDWSDNRAQTWNVTLERQLSGQTGLRLSYIGTHGSDLEQRFQANSPESEWNYQARTGEAIPGRTDLRRVNPDWNLRPINHSGFSNSHSLQAEIERRYSNGLAFQWFYTFSRSLTTNDTGGFTSGGGNINTTSGTTQTPENIQILGTPNLSYEDRLRLGYYNSGEVPPHRIRWNAIYDLPFGRGKKFGNSASGALNQIIGGWQIASIGSWRSGNWSSVATDRYLFGDPTLSSDERLELTLGGRRQRLFFRGDFNPEAATDVDQAALQNLVPSDRSQRILRPLNPARGDNRLPQTLADGSIRLTNINDTVNWNARNFFMGAANFNVDMSIFKTFQLREQMNVRFTADFFNAFNKPNDVNPSATTGLQDLGVSASEPRIIQFSLRRNW